MSQNNTGYVTVELEEDPYLEGTNKVLIPIGVMRQPLDGSTLVYLRTTKGLCAAMAGEQSSGKLGGIDKYLRIFIGARSIDQIEIKIARYDEFPQASSITLLGPPSFQGEDIQKLVKHRSIGIPFCAGQKRAIYGATSDVNEIEVANTEPSGIVLFTTKTKLIMKQYAEKTKPTGITFKDIGGLTSEIQQIRRLIEFPLRSPDMFNFLGISMPKGVILYGPPGTGKTLIAKALCNEVGATFYSIQGPEIVSGIYGESEAKLRKIFEQARKTSPSIILIDEIDAIAPKRDQTRGELEQRMVTTLLSLMDGIQELSKVAVIGTTNRINSIDAALRRPGRFEYEIHIGAPNLEGRKEILKIHTRCIPSSDIDLNALAKQTPGFTGADLSSLVRESAYCALERHFPKEVLEKGELALDSSMKITESDFKRALTRVKPSAMREVTVQSSSDLKWSDIGGLTKAKEAVLEIVEAMQNQQSFREMGVKPPKGLLLYGPAGTGKTLLATLSVNEVGANLIVVRGPELRSRWFGESEEKVRFIFSRAREVAPCVILFDEIDALAPSKEGGSSELAASITNQLLAELDGLRDVENVLVIATTNLVRFVEPALLRPGRFDRQIEVPLPDDPSRQEIFGIHTKNMPLDKTVNLKELAKLSEDFSGADIAAICRLSALNALRKRSHSITMADFTRAIEETQRNRADLSGANPAYIR